MIIKKLAYLALKIYSLIELNFILPGDVNSNFGTHKHLIRYFISVSLQTFFMIFKILIFFFELYFRDKYKVLALIRGNYIFMIISYEVYLINYNQKTS